MANISENINNISSFKKILNELILPKNQTLLEEKILIIKE